VSCATQLVHRGVERRALVVGSDHELHENKGRTEPGTGLSDLSLSVRINKNTARPEGRAENRERAGLELRRLYSAACVGTSGNA
jgi:hypothetical protein